jgi:hypothetical protein
MNDKKVGNRSRRLAAKLREILLGIKDRESQIQAVASNTDLSAEDRDALVGRLRSMVAAARSAANRLSYRQKELAHTDTRPVTADSKRGTHFVSHTDVLTDDRKNPTKWTQLSRRQCKCTRAFFAVAEAYAR